VLGPFRQLGGQAYFSLSIGLGGMVVLIRISPQTVSKEDVSMQYGGRQWSRPYCMEELTLQTTHLFTEGGCLLLLLFRASTSF